MSPSGVVVLVIRSYRGSRSEIAEVSFPASSIVLLDDKVPMVYPGSGNARLCLNDVAASGKAAYWVYPFIMLEYRSRLHYFAGFMDAFAVDIRTAPMVSWAWRKEGGTNLILRFHLRNNETGQRFHLTYGAGVVPQACRQNWGVDYVVSKRPPEQWTVVRRDIIEDTKKKFGLKTENLRVIGVTLAPLDGVCGYFDAVRFSSR